MVDLEKRNRKRFYERLWETVDDLPEGWSIEDRTVYTSMPTFSKEIDPDTHITLSVSIKEDDEVGIISSVRSVDTTSVEHKLGYRWEVETPEEAAVCLVESCIPKVEEEF